jgi:hypothetical protein
MEAAGCSKMLVNTPETTSGKKKICFLHKKVQEPDLTVITKPVYFHLQYKNLPPHSVFKASAFWIQKLGTFHTFSEIIYGQ